MCIIERQSTKCKQYHYYIPWTIHPGRLSWRLSDLDIKTALAYFAERAGKEVTSIMLHPSIERRLPGIPIPDGITVEYSYRVLAHEVFLPVLTDPPKAVETKQDAVEPCNAIVSKEILPPIISTELCNTRKRGRPPLPPDCPVSRQTLWRRKKKLQGILL